MVIDNFLSYVITTINAPTPGVRSIAKSVDGLENNFFVIGDIKTPESWNCANTTYVPYAQQKNLAFQCAKTLPPNSYTRKSLGYLLAAAGGASWIRETDDDNSPLRGFFDKPKFPFNARVISNASKWINVYPYFTDRFVWPRGLPLNKVHLKGPTDTIGEKFIDGGLCVFQSLADGDPDVDAVYRLTAPDTTDIAFRNEEPLLIPRGSWTPFNSQATTWPRKLFPLMYLPVTCSFRMTDIWRSFIALRIMHEVDANLVFTSPLVHQNRNEHDLMTDFRDEIEGYVGYDRFIDVISSVNLSDGIDAILHNLRITYKALTVAGFFKNSELHFVDSWIQDMQQLGF